MHTVSEAVPSMNELLGHEVTPALLAVLGRYQFFPKSAHELIRVIGADAASSLITAWGGQVFNVPAVIGGGNPLGAQRYRKIARVIGEQAAKSLVSEWRGLTISVPNLKEVRHAYIQDVIRREFDSLVTHDRLSSTEAVFDLGVKYRLAGKTIEKILKKPLNQTINQE